MLQDGDYILTITHVIQHPDVDRPGQPIPEDSYKAADEKETFRVRFSDGLSEVTILPRKILGALESTDGEWPRVYKLGEGLFAGGQLLVEETKGGLHATFTEYGSGVPVIASSRGPLTPAETNEE